jgi:hypothetical protein
VGSCCWLLQKQSNVSLCVMHRCYLGLSCLETVVWETVLFWVCRSSMAAVSLAAVCLQAWVLKLRWLLAVYLIAGIHIPVDNQLVHQSSSQGTNHYECRGTSHCTTVHETAGRLIRVAWVFVRIPISTLLVTCYNMSWLTSGQIMVAFC